MRRMLTITAVGLAGCALALAAAAPAFAHHISFDKNEQKCRKIVAKDLGKLVKTADKAIAICHKNQQKSIVGNTADCNDLADPNVDDKGKFATAVTKGALKIAKLCTGLDTDVLDQYRSCPVDPCPGVTNNPMADFGEVAACMACIAQTSTETRAVAMLGNSSPGGAVLQGDDAKCHQAIAKGYGKLVNTIDKDRTTCQKSQDKLGETDVNLHCNVTERNCSTNADCQLFLAGDTCVGCIGSDEKGKIATGVGKAESLFDAKCAPLGDTTGLFPCGGADPVATKACLKALADDQGNEVVRSSYELDPTICPVGLTSTFVAGAGKTLAKFCTSDPGTPSCQSDSDCLSGVCERISINSRTHLEVGWNGLGHSGDLPDQYKVGVGLDCTPNTNTPCGDCTITGIDTTAASTAYNRRCQENHRIPCTSPIGTIDGACPGLGICSYYLSGPVNFNASNTPTCVLNRIDQDITGTANPETGEGAQNLHLRSLVYLGLSQEQPCSLCGGVCTAGQPSTVGCIRDSQCDSVPNSGDGVCDVEADTMNDGVKDGRCIGGTDSGSPCDVNNIDATFGPTSLDCGLPIGANASGLGLQINLALTTASQSMPFGIECENPFYSPCACAVCTGNQSVACNSNAECALIGAGDCNSKGGANAADRFPNACDTDSFVCTDTGAEGGGFNGQCDSKTDTFCDGLLRANGEGFLFCATNGDCGTLDPACGGDCGNCDATLQRRCFLNPIQATGIADPDEPVLVGTFCVPPTTNNAINLAVGLPGAARVKIDLLTELKY